MKCEEHLQVNGHVYNSLGAYSTALTTHSNAQSVVNPPRAPGSGSRAKGGDLLFLALATCCCNNVYREATKHGFAVEHREVDVAGQSGAEAEPASQIHYHAKITADATAV